MEYRIWYPQILNMGDLLNKDIPNKQILLYPYGERMLGDGFKFADYYSSYGLKDIPLDMTTAKFPTIQSIIEDYRIEPSIVEKKKDEIFYVFPR